VAKYRYHFEVDYEVVRLSPKAPYVKVVRAGTLREPAAGLPAAESPFQKQLLSLRASRAARSESKLRRPPRVFERSAITSVTAFGEVATWTNPWIESAPSPWAGFPPHPVGSDVHVRWGITGPAEIVIANYGMTGITLESVSLLANPAEPLPVSQFWSITHDPTANGPVTVAPGATATILLRVQQMDYPEAVLEVVIDGGVQRYWLEARPPEA